MDIHAHSPCWSDEPYAKANHASQIATNWEQRS